MKPNKPAISLMQAPGPSDELGYLFLALSDANERHLNEILANKVGL